MTTEEPPWDDAEGTCVATFKGGKGYEEPWLVLRAGSAETLRVRIIAAFDLDGDELSLVEAIHNANVKFHAMSAIGNTLGGRVVQPARSGNDAWAAAESAATEPTEPADPNAAMLTEIETATTVDQLKLFWVNNNPLNEVVEAAWRAKGKSLQEGGSN